MYVFTYSQNYERYVGIANFACTHDSYRRRWFLPQLLVPPDIVGLHVAILERELIRRLEVRTGNLSFNLLNAVLTHTYSFKIGQGFDHAAMLTEDPTNIFGSPPFLVPTGYLCC